MRADTTQEAIVAGLRGVGCTVQILSQVGDGCPDLLVGRGGVNYLLEVKTGKGKLSSKQREWHCLWRGQVSTVWTLEEALALLALEEG